MGFQQIPVHLEKNLSCTWQADGDYGSDVGIICLVFKDIKAIISPGVVVLIFYFALNSFKTPYAIQIAHLSVTSILDTVLRPIPSPSITLEQRLPADLSPALIHHPSPLLLPLHLQVLQAMYLPGRAQPIYMGICHLQLHQTAFCAASV